MGRPSRRNVLGKVALLGLAAVAGAMLLGPAQAQDAKKVRLGYNYSLWGAPVVIAIETGIFKKNGLEVEGRRFGSGKDARDALIADSVDMATIGGTPFVVGVSTGEMNAIAAVAYTGGTGCLMVRQDLNAQSLDDLKGKKIASRPGSTIDSILKGKIFPALNAKADDYEFVNIDFKDQISGIAGGSVDAFAGVEPFCALAESQKLASKLISFEKYDILPNMLASTDGFVDANPETAKAVVKSIAEAGDMFRNDPDKVTEILHKLYSTTGYSLDKETLGRLLKTVDVRVKYVDGLDKYFANEAKILSDQGKLPGSGEVDWSKKLRPEFNASVGG